ncbi:hypothetical protein ILP97_07690 [Amycolatopsis sp. H6(2020)]|nr:hypothetical protein [Amycolatopsis sp. H6(2020)]
MTSGTPVSASAWPKGWCAAVRRSGRGRRRPRHRLPDLLTAADGLQTPTSVAVHGSKVYVPSAAYLTNTDPHLLVAHLGC